MSANNAESNDLQVSRLLEYGPTSSRRSQQRNIGGHYVNPANIINRRKWSIIESKTAMECYISGFLNVRGYGKPVFIL